LSPLEKQMFKALEGLLGMSGLPGTTNCPDKDCLVCPRQRKAVADANEVVIAYKLALLEKTRAHMERTKQK